MVPTNLGAIAPMTILNLERFAGCGHKLGVVRQIAHATAAVKLDRVETELSERFDVPLVVDVPAGCRFTLLDAAAAIVIKPHFDSFGGNWR